MSTMSSTESSPKSFNGDKILPCVMQNENGEQATLPKLPEIPVFDHPDSKLKPADGDPTSACDCTIVSGGAIPQCKCNPCVCK
ncbi:hypothetical protein B0H12DRAFT_1236146 [Mycena haematopus]|nr:hypothetical protein B0H12DRAFT_1236146 [Mycena haematopus]